jgi:hypothetical protein
MESWILKDKHTLKLGHAQWECWSELKVDFPPEDLIILEQF